MTISHGFELQREERLNEINSTARLYRHQRTGAQLLSLINDDENKVFGISFRTPPSDSTGIAHILEHSVLCGSRKYPVKEPFVELMKSSLQTFLNAMTYPDKTVYPVASQNLRDFYNLVDVYVDAVLHPRITPEIFLQEGWHYELDSVDAPLTYKGVVFNEMKGAYSSPDDRVGRLSGQSLYPDITYGVDSGGNPRHIPDLTYAAFKSFHERYYHPSNAQIFFYGDDDPEQRLELMDARLAEFSAIEVDSAVGLQPRFNEPRQLKYTFAGSADQPRQARITVNWAIDEMAGPEARLALAIAGRILTGSPAAPLRKALIDSRLGDGLTDAGLESCLRQAMFTVGLKGIDEASAGKVEALVLDTLGGLVRDGIDPMTVEAAVNTMEFRLRENNSGTMPRGIVLMLNALDTWLYGRDPLGPLAFAAPLASLKARLAKGERVFEDVIRRHLLDNTHRTTALFVPDPEAAARDTAEERARLDAVRAAMSQDELKAAVEQTHLLKEMQEAPDSPEALATIPTLTLKDLPVRNTPIPMETGELNGTRILTHDLATNGIVYLDVGLDLRALPGDLLPYANLFRRALLETGAGSQDFVALSQRIGRSTGGITSQAMAASVIGQDEGAAWLFLRAKAMPDKTWEMLTILRDVLLTARLDNRERIVQLVHETRTALEARLIPQGSGFTEMRLKASLEEAGWANEQMSGISNLMFLRELSAQIEKDGGEALAATLERIRATLVNRAAMLCNVTVGGGDLRRFESELGGFLETLPAAAVARPAWTMTPLPRAEGLTIPAKVNYVSKGENLHKLGWKPGGEAMVAHHYLRTTWLWDKVRVQGGAYGGYCTYDRRSGAFIYSSYRDPNLLKTLDIYDGSAAFLREAALGETDLVRAIIGTIGRIDTYRLPDAKGFTSLQWYLTNDSEEDRQRIREEVLGTTAAGIRSLADALDAVAKQGRVVVVGSEEAIAEANAGRDGMFTVSKVL